MYIGTAGLLFACSPKEQKENSSDNFKYLVDEFADLKVMRYQIPEWDSQAYNKKNISIALAKQQNMVEILFGINTLNII